MQDNPYAAQDSIIATSTEPQKIYDALCIRDNITPKAEIADYVEPQKTILGYRSWDVLQILGRIEVPNPQYAEWEIHRLLKVKADHQVSYNKIQKSTPDTGGVQGILTADQSKASQIVNHNAREAEQITAPEAAALPNTFDPQVIPAEKQEEQKVGEETQMPDEAAAEQGIAGGTAATPDTGETQGILTADQLAAKSKEAEIHKPDAKAAEQITATGAAEQAVTIEYSDLQIEHQGSLLSVMPHQNPQSLMEIEENITQILNIQRSLLTEPPHEITRTVYWSLDFSPKKVLAIRDNWKAFIQDLNNREYDKTITLDSNVIADKILEQAESWKGPILNSLQNPELRNQLDQNYLYFDLFTAAMGKTLQDVVPTAKNPDGPAIKSNLRNRFKTMLLELLSPTVAGIKNCRSSIRNQVTYGITKQAKDIIRCEISDRTSDTSAFSIRSTSTYNTRSTDVTVDKAKYKPLRAGVQVQPAMSLHAILLQQLKSI